MTIAIGDADGLGVANTGDNISAVCFDLHAAAAPVALLTAPQLMIDRVHEKSECPREDP